MDNSEIKSLSVEELRAKIAEEKGNLNRLKFAHSISQVENPMQIREARKLVARLSTELTVKNKAKA